MAGRGFAPAVASGAPTIAAVDERQRDVARRAATGAHDGVVGGSDRVGFTTRLDRWVADARVDLAAAQRTRERWLEEVAAQEATLVGVLVDLAERRSVVALATTDGRRHRGVIGSVGADFVAVRAAAGPDVLISLSALAAVRTLPDDAPVAGDRVVLVHLTLAEVLSELAADRERVAVLAGTEHVAGELRSVGADVVVLRTDGAPPASAYLSLRTVREVTLH